MVYEKPVLDNRSSETLGKWFAKVYKEQKVRQRGTSVRGGSKVLVYSLGPEVLAGNGVEIKACRKCGNFIQVELVVTRNRGFTTQNKESSWWALLELPLEKLPPGTYALEVIWLDKQVGFDTAERHVTAFSVAEDEKREKE
jgi:hypothetical protein